MKDIIIGERYRVDRKIGAGGFGLVYSGADILSNDEVTIKLMPIQGGPEVLRGEREAYKALNGNVGIPRVRWFGDECDFYVLVIDALGPSLEDLLNYCDRKLSLKTILLIADQAIPRIQQIHRKGLLHRDIKPDNFLLGAGKQGSTIYAIDFGLAKDFDDAKDWKDIEGLAFCGTSRYASINSHNGREQSWGDDLESLGYDLVYLARGSLPWQGLKAATDGQRDARIKEIKEGLSGEELCDGLPKEFGAYINYTRCLAFDDKPDYSYLRRLFRNLFQAEGFKYDHVFDWTEKLFEEMQGKARHD